MNGREADNGARGGRARRAGPALLAAALALLAAPVVWNVLSCWFYYDDIYLYPYLARRCGFVGGLLLDDGWLGQPGLRVFRPFTNLVLWLLPRLFGAHAGLYHLAGLAFHAASALLLYSLARRLSGNRVCGAVAATLFFFHQAGTVILCWVAANHALHVVFFVLLCLWAWARYLDGGRPGWLALALGSCALAPLSEETGAILPAYAVLLAEFLRRGRMTTRRRAALYPAFVLSLLPCALLRVFLRPVPVAGTHYFIGPARTALSSLWVLSSLFLPANVMCMEPHRALFCALAAALACALPVSLALFLRASRLKSPLFWFSLLCLLGYLACVVSFQADEKVAYFASPFAGLLVASLFAGEPARRSRACRVSAAALYLLLMANNYALLVLRTRDWVEIGRVNRETQRIFGEIFDALGERTVHAVGFNAYHLFYMRGAPILGPVEEAWEVSDWYAGKSVSAYGWRTRLRAWSRWEEFGRAYAGGGGVRPDDIVVSLARREVGGRHIFSIERNSAEGAVRAHGGAARPRSPALPLPVNFQSFHAFLPLPGVEIDEGRAYAPWRGHGWDRPLEGVDMNWERWRVVEMDRMDAGSQMRDTFVWGRGGARWEIDLPNGSYRVSLGWGNAHYAALEPQGVVIQGRDVGGNGAAPASEFFELRDIPVEVSDGKLRVELVPGRPGGRVILNWLEIGAPAGKGGEG